jgi:outer membrane protein assembly factor BamB
VVWKNQKQAPHQASPICVDNNLYMISDTGILSCMDARTGKVHYVQRLGGNYSSSPLYANGKIYFFSRDGQTTVFKPGDTYEVLAVNHLDDGFMASAAVADNALYLRTKKHLYRVEEIASSN